MLQKIIRVCFLAPLLLEIYSFTPSNVKYLSSSRALRMVYNTFVTVDSMFETPCSLIADSGVSLSDYMQLPVDQYVCIKMPLDATLERMEGSKFNMTVPPVRFFTLDVSPTIICNVGQNSEYVTIESSDCTLRGSPYVVGLNGCYRLKISAIFSWFDSPTKKVISSKTIIGLEVDPPAPFKYFGKSILETTGRLALSIALSEIGNAFVQALASDYEKWATSETYRIERAGGLCHVDTEEELLAALLKGTGSGLAAAPRLSPVEKRLSTSPLPVPLPLSLSSEPVPIAAAAIEKETASPIDSTLTLTTAAPVPASTVLSVEESEILLVNVVTKNSLPVLTDDICLFPGSEPIVRVEEAPSNSRRIFTGVDIMADMESIWDVLTAFDRLQDVVPSLVKNEVLFLTPEGGARLAQVGGAKVLPGVTFTAKTVLDVCVYKEDNPLSDDMLALSSANGASSADVRAVGKALPLQRGIFPRPYSLTRLPHRDITMQNVQGEGDFEHYQGVWRMQSLPNCAPNGGNASRLTYAVEIKPKGILPVKLIEGRIAADLKANMAAIREFVEAAELKKAKRIKDEAAESRPVLVAAPAVVETIAEPTAPAPSLTLAPVQVPAPQVEHGGKRRGFFRAITRLFRGNRGVEAVESTGKQGQDNHVESSRGLDVDQSSLTFTEDSSDTVTLLEENSRLKDRVAYLEREMDKANTVLRKIEVLSKLD